MNGIKLVQSFKLPVLLWFLAAFLVQNSNAQTIKMRTITGAITSPEGEPLIGATINVKDADVGTTTNIDGEYTITVEDSDNLVLQIAYLGFEDMEVAVGDRKTIDIQMREASALLEELVVIGYSTKKRIDVVGAISSIDTEAFNKGVISTPEQLLQAKVPGVRITSSSGEPGAGVNLTIRGAGSIRSGNSPLYVIDGVALSNEPITPASSNLSGADIPTVAASKNPLNFLNPDDIASIDVLKDASATAIYGSRGSNGVVIITTKKGKAGQSALSYNGYVGTSSVAKKIDVFTPDSVQLVTDWQDEILRSSALAHNHNISYSGGSQRASYRTSLSYFDQDGVIDKSALRRLTGRLNTTLFVLPGDRLRLDLNLVSSNVVDNGIPRSDISDTSGELITATLSAASDRTVFGSDNNYSSGPTNPTGLLNAWNDVTTTNRILGSLSAGVDIVEGLKYQFNLGIDRSGALREQELQPNNLEGININNGSYSFANIDANNRLFENFLTYNTLVNDNQFEVLIGHAYQRFEVNSFTQSASNFAIPSISALDDSANAQNEIAGSKRGSHEINKLESIFGRVNYTWNDKLLVTASMRADGSSKFGANNRWGYFPAISAAYRLGDIVNGFDDLKVRVGWGQTGNQEIPNKATQETFEVTAAGVSRVREANPDLKWEVSNQFNIGADFTLAEERLYGSIDYFNKVNTDPLLLVDSEPPSVSQKWINLNGEIKNQGVELFLGSALLKRNNLSLNVDVNGTFTSNEVSLPDGQEIFTGILSGRSINGTLTQVIKDGESLGSFFIFEDNEDGTSTENRVINGTGIPNFVYGINAYLNYEKLDIGLNFSGVNGNKIYNATDNFLLNFGGNVSERVAAQADIPAGASSFFLEDGNFLRLNNLTIGYTIGTGNTDWLSNARIYVTGQNLFVLTDYSGYDPEVNTPSAVNGNLSYGIDFATYPRARTFLVGVNLGF